MSDMITTEGLAELLSDTWFGRRLTQTGREEGRESLLATLLRQRFGDDPRIGETAHRLARWPESVAVMVAQSAASLDAVPQEAPPA